MAVLILERKKDIAIILSCMLKVDETMSFFEEMLGWIMGIVLGSYIVYRFLKKMNEEKPKEIAPSEDNNTQLLRCRTPMLHNIKKGKCIWCKKTVEEIKKDIKLKVEEVQP